MEPTVTESESKQVSGYYIKQQSLNQDILNKVQLIKQRISNQYKKPPQNLWKTENYLTQVVSSLEQSRKTDETWIYIDMDMFYASIEIRDNPSLSNKPIAIINSGIVSTANYLAREFGIKSSIPKYKAEILCPNLISIPQDLDKYRRESEKIKEIFKEFDPDFEKLGLDEAGLQVTGILKRRSTDTDDGRQALATEIRAKIYEKTQLTSSAGIACNKSLSKLCSKINKPNGQFYLRSSEIKDFIKNVDIGSVPGISKNDSRLLKLLGVQKCGDFLDKKIDLYFGLKEEFFDRLLKSTLGLGPIDHKESFGGKKTVSASKSFEPTDNITVLEDTVLALAKQLHVEMNKNKLRGKSIEIIIKSFEYTNHYRKEVTKSYFHTCEEIGELGLTLLRLFYPVNLIRGITLKISKIKNLELKKYVKVKSKVEKKHKASEFESLFVNSRITPEKTRKGANNVSVKIVRVNCDRCGKWLSGTEIQMNEHMRVCDGLSNNNHL